MPDIAVKDWFHCSNCEKDVWAELETTVVDADPLTKLVKVEVKAICNECGATLSSKEMSVSL